MLSEIMDWVFYSEAKLFSLIVLALVGILVTMGVALILPQYKAFMIERVKVAHHQKIIENESVFIGLIKTDTRPSCHFTPLDLPSMEIDNKIFYSGSLEEIFDFILIRLNKGCVLRSFSITIEPYKSFLVITQ